MSRKRDLVPVPDRNVHVADLIRVRRTQLRVPEKVSYSQRAVADRVDAHINTFQAIENGELRHRDPGVLDNIARELDMTPGERRALYLIFNNYEPHAVPGIAPPDCVDDHRALIDHLPHPAYVTDAQWTVRAVNAAVRCAMPGFEEGVNVFEWVLDNKAAREVLINWYDVWALRTLRSLKSYAAVTGDLFLVSLYRRLRRNIEHGDDVIGYFEPTGEIRSLLCPDGSALTFRYQIYRLSSDQPSQYRFVNLIPTADAPLPVSDPTARLKARKLDRDLTRGSWRIPEAERPKAA